MVKYIIRQNNDKTKTLVIHMWTNAALKYSVELFDWMKQEPTVKDGMIRKIMTIYGALHPKSDVTRVYVSSYKVLDICR